MTGAATEDGSLQTLNALANASDIDSASLTVVGIPTSLPGGVTYDATARTFTLNPGHAAYQGLAAGQTAVVTVAYGVSDGSATTPASVSWTVTGVSEAPVVSTPSHSVVGQLSSQVGATGGQVPMLPRPRAALARGSLVVKAAQVEVQASLMAKP